MGNLAQWIHTHDLIQQTEFIRGEPFLSDVSQRDDKVYSVSGAIPGLIGLEGRGENTNKIPGPPENPGYPGDQTVLRSK